MKEFNPFDVISKTILNGEQSVKLWITVCFGSLLMLFVHQQWAQHRRPPSILRLVLWGAGLYGLFLLSRYLSVNGYYDRLLIRFGLM